ncbi:MAG TPA: cell division protein SepF [Candidatus Woesearchaeota archaeon]|nr:cell division protein SepF [Candidatus Woesearchaeota archaeon]
MVKFLKKFAQKFKGDSEYDLVEGESEYVELDADKIDMHDRSSKIIIKPYTLNDFVDTKPIVDVLREGNTIALINIQPLKEKDLMEVKRAIARIKKTIDAVDGDIAGFGEDYLVATPPFARIERHKKQAKPQKKDDDDFETF